MRRLLISILVIFFSCSAFAQATNDPTRPRFYKTTIHLRNSVAVQVGYLKAITDSTITIVPYSNPVPQNAMKGRAEEFNYKEISKVSVRRKGATGRAILAGALSGVAVGAITGFASGDDPRDQWIFRMTAGEKAILNGFFFGTIGTLVGTLVGGLSTKKFIIAANHESFQKMKKELSLLKGWNY